MMRRTLGSSGGFTYITVLVLVMITGILAARGGIVWKTAMQREREVELISRGTQIRDAMRRWYKFKQGADGKWASPKPPDPVPANLPELKSLLKDPNVAGNLRYLRLYALTDPMTGEEWEPVKRDGRIVGVKSTSEKEPIKQGNFPLDLHPADFEKKKKYSEWEFIYDRVPPTNTEGVNNPNNPAVPAGF